MTEGPVEGEGARPAGYEHDDPELFGSLEGTDEDVMTEIAEEGGDEDATQE